MKAWNEHGHQAGDFVLGWKRHHFVFHCLCLRWREILCREKTSSEMFPLPNFKRRKPLCSINRLNRVFVMTTNYLLQKAARLSKTVKCLNQIAPCSLPCCVSEHRGRRLHSRILLREVSVIEHPSHVLKHNYSTSLVLFICNLTAIIGYTKT